MSDRVEHKQAEKPENSREKWKYLEGTGFAPPGAGDEEKAIEARRWLERMVSRAPSPAPGHGSAVDPDAGGFFDGLALCQLRVVSVGGGRALCTFQVPAVLADKVGHWRAGPMTSVIDYVGAAAIVSVEGVLKASVDLDVTYLNPVRVQEEVEVEAWVLKKLGKLTAVMVEIRKKGSKELVAFGRQWLSLTPLAPAPTSNL